MSKKLLNSLYQGRIISEIDFHFARLIVNLAVASKTAAGLAAALVSRATGAGAVCLDLKTQGGQP